MQEETIRSVLRIVAIVTMLVGAIRTTTAIIALSAARDAMGELAEAARSMAQLGSYQVLGELAVFFWGAALWGMSRGLARAVRG